MKYGDYLFDREESELSLEEKLKLMDRALIEVHSKNEYVVSSLLEAQVVNDLIIPSSMSFAEYDPEIDKNAQQADILELAAIGLCACNRFGEEQGFPNYYYTPDFIAFLMTGNNVEKYLERPDIPQELKDYYRSVFTLLKVDFLNVYLNEQLNGGKGEVRVKNYSTPEGRAFANKNDLNDGFTSIIAIPAVLAIVYIISMVIIIAVKLLK